MQTSFAAQADAEADIQAAQADAEADMGLDADLLAGALPLGRVCVYAG